MNTAARQHLPTDNLAWFKSSYSSNEGGNCLEVAAHPSAIHVRDSKNPSAIHVRDSKNPSGPVLTLSPGAWAAFLDRD